MRKPSRILLLLLCASLIGLVAGCQKTAPGEKAEVAVNQAPAPVPPPACAASAAWVSAPNPPVEIGGPGVPVNQETFCQFYQFAEQWFLSLVSPSGSSGDRTFETFNVVGASGLTACPTTLGVTAAPGLGPKLKGKAALKESLFVRVNKPETGDFDPVLPANLGQAGTGDALYDQNGNVVLYAMLYNDTECAATAAGFSPNTIEVKTSWKVLAKADPSYYTMNATVQFSTGPKKLTLGLVGFHLAINTALHPEFIWVTYEHKTNDPDCNKPQTPPAAGWDFTSAPAAQCLASGGINACTKFAFNQGAAPTTPTGGKPIEVCRTYPDGTDPVPPAVGPNGNHNEVNQFTIDTLNQQLVGSGGILTSLPASNPMAVFANYRMEGSLWTNGGQTSTDPNNLRGSLELANTTMETFVQKAPNTANVSCFGCHHFKTATPTDVSHIYQGAPGKQPVLRRLAARRK